MSVRLALVALCLVHSSLYAQAPPANSAGTADNKDLSTTYINVLAGRMLPYGIYGVRSIIPYWGVRLGHAFGESNLEWTMHLSNGEGVKYYNGSVSFAFPSELEGWKFIPLLGLDVHYFSGRTTSGPRPYSTSMGFHFGVSPLFELGKNAALRADFKFNYNPGQSLQVGGGLQFYF